MHDTNGAIPEPVEASVYRRLHEDRETHINERRRARQAQADVEDAIKIAGQEFGRGIIVGCLSGSIGTLLALAAVVAIIFG